LDVREQKKDTNCFKPDKKLIGFMEEKLHVEKMKKALTLAGKELSHADQQKRQKLKTNKVRLLNDIVFPAMANLTYFFECIANHPELQSIFEDDLKDLFGMGFHFFL
jgi:hypothetical protein